MNQKIGIGVVGCGHWGINHVRVFSSLPESQVVAVADTSKARLDAVGAVYPGLRLTTQFEDLLLDPTVEAIVVATPTSTHYDVVLACLEAGKDVLCEKPLTPNVAQAERLVSAAEERAKVLMVGHIFVANDGIQKLKEYIDGGTLGKLCYLHSTRVNLGPVRRDVSVVWDLASHDISIFNYLLGAEPLEVSATGGSFLQPHIADVALLSLLYPESVLASCHVSWLSPRKERQITIVGDKRMVIWDDLKPEETIRLYESSVPQEPFYKDYREFQLIPKEGDVAIPKLRLNEPLRNEAVQFLESLRSRKPPVSDGRFGLEVVRALEKAEESLRGKSQLLRLP